VPPGLISLVSVASHVRLASVPLVLYSKQTCIIVIPTRTHAIHTTAFSFRVGDPRVCCLTGVRLAC
jgi:hypothetical protein